jgi:phosphoenolpyruvate carboxykinase (ATP)
VLTECPGVPPNILNPKSTWADKTAYDETAKRPAGLFRNNFTKYEGGEGVEVKAAGPAA